MFYFIITNIQKCKNAPSAYCVDSAMPLLLPTHFIPVEIMKKNFLLILVFVGLTSYAQAQHEFSIAVGANYSAITGPVDGSYQNEYFETTYSVSAKTDAQVGLTSSAQYAYYVTPHLKPYLKYARTSVNCNSSFVNNESYYGDPYSRENVDVDYNIFRTSLSYGIAYEWNNGLGVSLGFTNSNLKKMTLDGARRMQYTDYPEANDNSFIEEEHDLTTSSSNFEVGLIYRIGNFTIEFLQQTANLEEVSNHWIIPSGYSTDPPSNVGTSNFLLGYSYFISK